MIIYEANETDFFSNGLGTLPDATSALVTEERNGEFVLDVIYPQEGVRSELLTKNRIIKADAGHELKDQRFVIKKVTPTMDSDGYIYMTVHAEHISYITADLGVTPNLTLSGNATQALEQWQANLVGGHPDIVVDSDIILEHETSLDITKATNARQVLGGVEGSILDVWGGEYKFDNLHISLRGQRGTTANTLISYGRNLLTFEQEDDITDTYTSIYPYANVGLADGNNSKLVTVDGYFVDSQYVDRYPNRKLLPVDFGSEFTDYKIGSKPSESDTGIYTIEAEIKKKLTELAKQYIENNRIGIPKVSTKITFADLSKTSEYAPLEQVNLCDIIPIRFEKLGIDTTIKVTRVVWNVLLDEYDSIELGDLRTTLGESISALESKTTGLANAVITAQSTADNQNSIFRTNGSTAEPVAKKVGDLWFKTDGDYQYMYQWDGAVWHEVVNTKDTDVVKRQVEQAQADLAQVRADATRISETQTESAKRLDEQMQELRAKTVDNATNVQNVIRDVAQAHADYVAQQADINKQKSDLEKAKQSLQTTSQNLDQARQDLLSNSGRLDKLEVGVNGVSINVNNLNTKVDNIKVGARNLLKNSDGQFTMGYGITNTTWENGKAVLRYNSTDVSRNSEILPQNAAFGLQFPVARGEQLTQSIYLDTDANINFNNNFEFTWFFFKDGHKYVRANIDKVGQNTYRLWGSYTWDKNDSNLRIMDIVNLYKVVNFRNSGTYLAFYHPQIERSSIPSDYSPAPEEQIEKVAQLKVDLDGVRGTVATNQGDIAQIKLTENGMQQNIKDAQGNISSLQNDAKQFKQQFSDVDGNIANLSASAKNFELQMQDAQGNISSLQNDAKGFKQQFADANGNIATIKRNATELSEQLASKVGNTEYQNFKTQTAKELSEKLVRTDLNGYATTAEVKLTADGLKEQYNSVNSKIDGLKIGGRNLLNNTDTLAPWHPTENGKIIIKPKTEIHAKYRPYIHSSKYIQFYNSVPSAPDGLVYNYQSDNVISLTKGDEYTVSALVWYYTSGDDMSESQANYPINFYSEYTNQLAGIPLTLTDKITGIPTKYSYTFKCVKSGDYGAWRFGLYHAYSGLPGGSIFMSDVQIEKSNIASDYSLSAKDVENAISGVSQDLTSYKAVVERDYAKSSSVYTKNEVVNLTNNSKDSAVNAIKNDTNWKGLVNINTNSAFLQTADGFEKEVVKKATPMVKGGGVNLLRNTQKLAWRNEGNGVISVLPKQKIMDKYQPYFHTDYVQFSGAFKVASDSLISNHQPDNIIEMTEGESYTISAVCWYYTSGDGFNESVANYPIKFFSSYTDENTHGQPLGLTSRITGIPTRYSYTFKCVKSGVYNEWKFGLYDVYSGLPGGSIYIADVKIENGTVATPYSPAPEDLATVVSVNKVIDTADSHTQIIKDYLTNDNSQFKLLKNAVNLKVEKGDVIGQINIEANNTLIQNKKVYLDADTVAFSGKAFIPSAAITDLSADKITTGTLNAANVKVINLDANNIRTGTLTGPGMALDLNNGSFKINNSDNSLKVEMDSGELRFYRQRNIRALTGTISASDWGFLTDNQQALNLTGQDGVVLKTENFKMTDMFMTSGWLLTTADVPSSDGSAVILRDNNVKIIGQTNSQMSNSRITMMTGKPYTYKTGAITNVAYTGIDIIGGEDQSGVVDITGGNEVNISGGKDKINLDLGFSSITASVANSSNYDDITRRSKITVREDAIYFSFIKDKEDLTSLALYNGGTVSVKDLSVWGSKNAIVQTTAGWTKINAYETAEYYFGDLGTAVTDDTSTVRIGIEPLFNETVNTDIPYQVFVTSYGKGYAWVAERGSDYFVIKSSVPNLEIGYEIKAKRKGYENVRLEIDKHMEVNKQ